MRLPGAPHARCEPGLQLGPTPRPLHGTARWVLEFGFAGLAEGARRLVRSPRSEVAARRVQDIAAPRCRRAARRL